MSDQRSAPRRAQSAETATLVLGLVAVLGNLAFAWLTPTTPSLPAAIYLLWIISLLASLNLNITIDVIELNFAGFFVLSAFLALGTGAALGILVASLFLSEFLNWILRQLRHDPPRGVRVALISIFDNLAVEGWGLLIGSLVYTLLGGTMPLTPAGTQWNIDLSLAMVLPVLALDAAYLLASFGVIGWLVRGYGENAPRLAGRHWRDIILLAILPALLSVALALAALNLPVGAFAITCALLVLSMVIAHRLSTARLRLERRIRELDSLTAIGQAVANSLELSEVLEAIHAQTLRLMDAQNFYIALYDETERRITFPLAYENNARVTYTSRLFGEGFTEYIILTRQPLLIKHDVRVFAQQIGHTSFDPQVQAWLGVPIAIGEQVLGVLAVQSRERANMYDESHRDILISIAAQAATAIRNSQMYMDVRRQTKTLFIMNSVLTVINATLNLDEILSVIVPSLTTVMECQKAAIFLADDHGQTAQLAAVHNLSAAFVAQGSAIPIGSDERTQVIATGQPLIISDTGAPESSDWLRSTGTAEGFSALAEVPLWTQNQVIGSLAVYYADPHTFTSTALEELTAFANQAAVAVANARLYARTDEALARRIEQLATLQDISLDVVSSLDLQEVMLHVLERASLAVKATHGSVNLWDEDQGAITVSVTHGYSPEETAHLKQTNWTSAAGLVGRAIRSGQSFYVGDVRLEPDYVAITPGTRSELVVLLKKEQRILGVINLESPQVGRFDQASLDFISQLATQTVIALENAQLYQSAQARLHDMSILYEVGQQLTSILDLTQLGAELTRLMARALRTGYCGLRVFDSSAKTLSLIGKYLAPDITSSAAQLDLESSYALSAQIDLQTVVTRYEEPTPSDQPTPDPAALPPPHLPALLTLPLRQGTELIGVVEWGDVQPKRRFTAAEIQFAQTLGHQATIAVYNARLFEERARRIHNLDELYQASLALSTSVELDELLRRISTVAREISRADAVTLYLYDKSADSFTRTYALGVTGDWSPAHLRSTGMTRRVIKEGLPILVAETQGHPEVNPHTVEAGIRSLIAVPLVGQGQAVGVMYVGSFAPQRFTPDVVQLVSALANQAAVAISNARLFSEIAENRDQLQAILDSTDNGLLIFEPDGRIVVVNPRLEAMWDVPHGWLNERRLTDLLQQPETTLAANLGYTPELLQRLLNQIAAGHSPTVTRQVYALPGQTPTRYVERACLPVLDAERQPIAWMMVLRDVTEELELQRMRDDLTNTIVHDLRSPLSSILGSLYFIEELSETQDPATPIRTALSISIRGANKLMNLVNSLLDIARLSAGQALVELQPQRLEAIVDAAVDYMRPLADESDIALSKYLEPDLPLVLLDEDKINRVLVNLIDNALKFTPRGGKVDVRVERWLDSEESSYVRCSVRDSGPGVPPEYRSRIFERFVQIANRPGRRRGTGIGLNFCHLAVEAHGGRIWVEDAPGGGSDFSFTLPSVAD